VLDGAQVTEPAGRIAAKAKLQAQAPLGEVSTQKLLESDSLRKAANKTVDAIRVGAGNVYEAAAALGSFQGKYPVGQQDLLVAFPADEAHVPLVQAGRQWHKVTGSVQACTYWTCCPASTKILVPNLILCCQVQQLTFMYIHSFMPTPIVKTRGRYCCFCNALASEVMTLMLTCPITLQCRSA